MNEAIKVFLPTAEAISRLLHPYAEVIVHDIIQNKIAAIYHPFQNAGQVILPCSCKTISSY